MQRHTRGPVINTPLKRIGFFIAALASVACGSASGPQECGPEYRVIGGAGDVALADGLSFVEVGVDLSESREPGRADTQIARVGVSVYAHLLSDTTVPSAFLRGHVTAIEVRDAGMPSRLIKSYVPPNPPPFLQEFYRYGMVYDWAITVDEARALFVADQVVIELRTDLASQPLIRIPLKQLEAGDPFKWSRTTISGGHC
jgi:hypothetical protein